MESGNKRLEESKVKEYVLGFCFNFDKSRVLLIEKKKPEFQKGFLNGIGGAIEEGEEPHIAMNREFREECGLDILFWVPFAVMTCKFQASKKLMKIWVYRTQIEDKVFNLARTMEEEVILDIQIQEFWKTPSRLMNNLKTLIPMALDDNFKYAMLNLSYE